MSPEKLDFNETLQPEPFLDKQDLASSALNALAINLSYLEDTECLTNSWLTAGEIEKITGIYRSSVPLIARRLGIEAESRTNKDQTINYYPPYTVALLMDDRKWKETFAELPSRLTIQQIADLLGKSYYWTASNLESVGIKQAVSSKNPPNGARLFNKSAIKRLRSLIRRFPLEGDHYNLNQLAEATGEYRGWVARRLKENNVLPNTRTSALTGRNLDYYPPSSLAVLRRAQRDRPELARSNMVTAWAISRAIKRSYSWCVLRLVAYSDLEIQYLDDQYVTRTHYPIEVQYALKAESDGLRRKLGERAINTLAD